MQIIISLLRHQASNRKDEMITEILNESQNRIRAMALIHEKLYSSEDLSMIDFREYW